MNSLAAKTQAPRTGTAVVTIMYNFILYPQVYGRAVPIRCRRYAVDADDDVRCVLLRSFRSTNSPDDCGTQFATLLLSIQFAARMLKILFYIYRLSSSGR